MRLSQKLVLNYLESVYPDWKTFQQICDELPAMFNFDFFELDSVLTRLIERGKIEKEYENYFCLPNWQRFRFRKETQK